MAVVFSFYMILAITLTLIHMFVEYKESHRQVSQELEIVANSFGPGIATALWYLNLEQVHSDYLGIMDFPEIVGVKIIDNKSQVIGIIGAVEDEDGSKRIYSSSKDSITTGTLSNLFSYRKLLVRVHDGDVINMGYLILFSSSEVVFNRVKYLYLFIVFSALIKSLGLWLIFLFVANKMLAKPLRQFVDAIDKIELNNMKESHVNIETYGKNELGLVQESFNKMLTNLDNAEEEKKVALEELKCSESMLKNLVHMLPVGVLYTDPHGNGIFANSLWSDLTGFSLDATQGYGLFHGLHQDDKDVVLQQWERTLSERQNFKEEYRLIRPDNSVSWVIGQARAEVHEKEDASGRVALTTIGYFCTITDITALKHAQERIIKLNESLEERVKGRTSEVVASNKKLSNTIESLSQTQDQLIESRKMAALGELVVGVAHEINTPLGVAMTAISYLNKQFEQIETIYQHKELTRKDFESFFDEYRKSSEISQKNMQRVAELVNQFKQAAIDQHSDKKRWFNVREYIQEALIYLEPNLENISHHINVTCADDFKIYSYPSSFCQIVSALLMNSLIHGFEFIDEGNIDISARLDGEKFRFNYRDNGKGMTEEQVERVFNPFFTTTRGKGGRGLGAFIAYNLITQRLGGTIECSSVVGKGVYFKIELPIK